MIYKLHKIVQLFCHHDGVWCEGLESYDTLFPNYRYTKVCKKCGKILDELIIPYSIRR